MFENQAIIVKNVTKIYGKEFKILDGLNLSVSKGSIYGLLGASGCGKTTLLSCIVGICKINSGDIWVLGGKPGSENSGIPGSRVGFMPQNISLVNEFSTIDAFYYFGRINGLRDDEIEERYVDLAELLQLPSKHQLVKNVSGGQQRRISFAAALLHRPELLILDEPTVGLDPILRDNIWNFLTKITQENGVTIVITTHYIDEARQANKIGLLRSGKLLAETTPNQLMDRFQCDNLEDAFLELSRHQQDNINSNVNDNSEMLDETEFVEGSINLPTKSMNASIKSTINLSVTSRKLKALIIKNIAQFLRHPGGILFSIGFPIIQLLVFHYSFGHDPKDLLIGVINRESNNCDFGKNQGNIIYTQNDICDFLDLSCRFLNDINNTTAKKIFYNYLPEMKDDLRKGKLSGMIYFDTNFTHALQRRLMNSRYVEDRDIEMGEIKIWLDMSNRQIGLFLKNKLYETYFESMRNIMTECHLPSKITNIPLSFEKPIFGKKNDDYINFSAPTFILSLTFFVATVMTTMILISDRHEGIWERSLVQGVTTSEILFSHFVVELSIVIIQVTLICCISFVYFNLDCKGSLVTVVMMIFFMGVCGLFYGFLVSVFCNSHLIADYIVTGSFYPIILLSGFLWPIEGIPFVIKWLSYCLPTTIPGVSLRAILSKGLSVNNPEVYKGFLVIGGWTFVMILLCLYGLKRKS
ncbi:ABC transporter G family member 20-like [Vespa crabro]|uniref:ABC transporter G family member 20-like n=1 Tax=Vespa crabro TaxID=7445 RepID=UPI001EFFC41A|nr:ABC transporter G family member 20-like [Vespa crabro]XP_046820343.1 ABC transporter G family member 20-like [Vespa crabro]XP_046820351.1 ABC transporter G family member 20-like [Vespa crabro]